MEDSFEAIFGRELGDDDQSLSFTRVKNKETRINLKDIEDQIKEINDGIKKKANLIYFEKEKSEIGSDTPPLSEEQLCTELDNLFVCAVDVEAARSTHTRLTVNDAICEEMKSLRQIPYADRDDSTVDILQCAEDNTKENVELCKILEEIEDEKMLILEEKIKLAGIQTDLNSLWVNREEKRINLDDFQGNPEITKALASYRRRRDKAQIMAQVCQNLLCGHSEQWGRFNRYFDLAYACQLMLTEPDRSDDILSVLPRKELTAPLE